MSAAAAKCYLKIRSGSHQAPVAQAADRVFTAVMTRNRARAERGQVSLVAERLRGQSVLGDGGAHCVAVEAQRCFWTPPDPSVGVSERMSKYR
jgi:hypothetical protein